MTGPAQAAAQPFSAPQEDASLLLARDMAYLLEHKGVENIASANQKTAMVRLGQGNCLQIHSLLELDKDATPTERQDRAWASVRIVAFMQPRQFDETGRIPVFNAICTDREAIKGTHPTAGLEKLPFVASDIKGGQWANIVRGLARAMRDAEGMDFMTYQPDAPRQRGPHWHST